MTTKKTVEAEPEVTEEETTGYTPKQLASELGTDPKTFRRFLRGLTSDRAGKGGRWNIDEEGREAILKAWNERSAKGTTPTIDADAE